MISTEDYKEITERASKLHTQVLNRGVSLTSDMYSLKFWIVFVMTERYSTSEDEKDYAYTRGQCAGLQAGWNLGMVAGGSGEHATQANEKFRNIMESVSDDLLTYRRKLR